jgi:hypothetical protein
MNDTVRRALQLWQKPGRVSPDLIKSSTCILQTWLVLPLHYWPMTMPRRCSMDAPPHLMLLGSADQGPETLPIDQRQASQKVPCAAAFKRVVRRNAWTVNPLIKIAAIQADTRRSDIVFQHLGLICSPHMYDMDLLTELKDSIRVISSIILDTRALSMLRRDASKYSKIVRGPLLGFLSSSSCDENVVIDRTWDCCMQDGHVESWPAGVFH